MKSWEEFDVGVEDGDIVVTLTGGNFKAVYYKARDRSQLILRYRTKTDDDELSARAWIAATDKARELGWIV